MVVKARLAKLEEKISKLVPDPPGPEDIRLAPIGLIGCKFLGPITLEADPLALKEAPLLFLWCKSQEKNESKCEGCEFNGYEEACRLIREGRADEVMRDKPFTMQVEEVNSRLWRITVWKEPS